MLKDETKFEKFIQHLMKEWSMEILLALIELTQMQSVIKQYVMNAKEIAKAILHPSNSRCITPKGMPSIGYFVMNQSLRYQGLGYFDIGVL